ncbi:MAG: PER33/POM33 family protein, partial [archaeon]|nr:PER33/POM33 family protein [archaeon]
NNRNQSNNNLNISDQDKFMSKIDLGLLFSFIFLIVSHYNEFACIILGGYFCYKLIVEKGFPRLDVEWITHSIEDENLHSLIFSVILLILSEHFFFFYIPNLILFIIEVDLILLRVYPHLNQNKFLKYIKDKKKPLMSLRAIYEIFYFLYLIPGFFLGTNGIFIIIVYIQFLKFKYYASKYTKEFFTNINEWMNALKNDSNSPLLLKDVLQFIQNASSYLLNCTNNFNAENVSIAVCNIF